MTTHAHEAHVAARAAVVAANTAAHAALGRLLGESERDTTAGGSAPREPTTVELERIAARFHRAIEAVS